MLALLLPAMISPVALASSGEAYACLQAQTTEGYREGWRSRVRKARSSPPSQPQYWMVQLSRGLEYRLVGCGDKDVSELNVYVYDRNARLRFQDELDGADPILTFRPPTSGTYFLGVEATGVSDGVTEVGVGVALGFR